MFMTTVNKCHSLNNEILNANSSITINLVMSRQVMIYWFMSSCHKQDISNNVIFA